jgi:hypothetical protein
MIDKLRFLVYWVGVTAAALVRWKDSIKEVMGLALAEVARTDQ